MGASLYERYWRKELDPHPDGDAHDCSSQAEKGTLNAIAWHADDELAVCGSPAGLLAMHAGVDERTTRRTLKALDARGIIELRARPGRPPLVFLVEARAQIDAKKGATPDNPSWVPPWRTDPLRWAADRGLLAICEDEP